MYGEFGRGEGEDKPARPRVHRRNAEYVGEKRTDLLGLRGVHDCMHSGDHAAILAAEARPWRTRCYQPSSARRLSSMPKWWATSWMTVLRTWSATSCSVWQIAQIAWR